MASKSPKYQKTAQCWSSDEELKQHTEPTERRKSSSPFEAHSPTQRFNWIPGGSSSCSIIEDTCSPYGRGNHQKQTGSSKRKSSEPHDGPRKRPRTTSEDKSFRAGVSSSPLTISSGSESKGKKRKRDPEKTEQPRKRSRKCNHISETRQLDTSSREAFSPPQGFLSNQSDTCRPGSTGHLKNPTGSNKRKSTEPHDGPRKKRTCVDNIFTDDLVFESPTASLFPNTDSFSLGSEGKKRKRDPEESAQPSKRSKPCDRPFEDPQPAGASSCDPGTPSLPPSNSREIFKAKYERGTHLGGGAFGTVYAGYRRKDNVPVAIKHIDQRDVFRLPMFQDGEMIQFPVEVAVLLYLRPAAGETSVAVTLLDWYDLDTELILVLERPLPCCDLDTYIHSKNYALPGPEAKAIIKQLLDGLIEIQSKGVYHGDIKGDNILIETGSEVPRVRLIDFGLAGFLPRRMHFPKQGTNGSSSSDSFPLLIDRTETHTVNRFGQLVSWMLVRCVPFRGRFKKEHEPEASVLRLRQPCPSEVQQTLKA